MDSGRRGKKNLERFNSAFVHNTSAFCGGRAGGGGGGGDVVDNADCRLLVSKSQALTRLLEPEKEAFLFQ